MSPRWNHIQVEEMWERQVIKLTFCTAGDGGDRENFSSVLNLKYFIPAVKFRWPTQKLFWPLRKLAWPSQGPHD